MTSPEQEPAPAKGKKKSNPAPAPEPAGGLAEASTRNLVILANGVGVEPPPDAGSLTPVDLSLPISVLGREFGMLSRASNLFNHRRQFVTVEPDGTLLPMAEARFASWIEKFVWPYKPKGDGGLYSRMPKSLAEVILASDQFRGQVRNLRAVSEVRLPVWRENGEQRTIELARPGYDEETGVLCLDLVPFDETADPFETLEWFLDTFKGFPFTSEADRARFALCMLSSFTRLLLPPGQKMLHQIYIANQVGSGKSLLAVAALAPCYGVPDPSPGATDRDELRKVLDATAMEGSPYLWLDDVKSLDNPALNAFMSSSRHKNRIMQAQGTARNVNEAIVIITGNGLTISPDIARRCVIVDLNLALEAEGRKFDQVLSESWFGEIGNRGRLLAFLWGMVRRWHRAGMRRDPVATRAGFHAHANLCGSIVRDCALGNAFEERKSTLGGDEESAAIKSLLRHAADRSCPDGREWRPAELLELAEECGMLDAICGWTRNPRQSLGHKLRNYRGRQFKDSKGRPFEFGKRDGSVGSIYQLRFLDE